MWASDLGLEHMGNSVTSLIMWTETQHSVKNMKDRTATEESLVIQPWDVTASPKHEKKSKLNNATG